MRLTTVLCATIDQRQTVQVAHKFRNSNLDVGHPRRVLLRRGDAVLAHQRLAHCAGPNGGDVTRTNVYFRIGRRDFDTHAHSYCVSPSPWLLFDPLKSYIQGDATADLMPEPGVTARQLLSLKLLPSPRRTLTAEDIAQFKEHGYVVIRDAVAPELIAKASSKIDTAIRNQKFNKKVGVDVEFVFNDHVSASAMLTDALEKSGLVNCAEQLLGEQNVTLLDGKADLHVTTPRDVMVPQEDDGNRPMRRGGWEVSIGKGRFWRSGADHTLRISVALSEAMEGRNEGQAVVWPGTLCIYYSSLNHNSLRFFVYNIDTV